MQEQIQLRLLDPNNQIVEWSKSSQTNQISYPPAISRQFRAHLGDSGLVTFHRYQAGRYTLWYNKFHITEQTTLHLQSLEDSIMLYFVVKGQIDYRDKVQSNRAITGNIFLMPSPMLDHDLLFSTGSYQVLHLFIPMDLLALFRQTFPILDYFLQPAAPVKMTTVADHDIRDDGRLMQVLGPILSETPRKVFDQEELTALCNKILMIGFEFFSGHYTYYNGLSNTEKDALKQVRFYLLEHIYDLRMPSLGKITSIAAMGEKKLEDIFKGTYGITMNEFFQTARMEAIYRKLREGTGYLQAIAIEFGYENYASFSAAVKNKFNNSPRQIQQLGRG
jgi:AraC-like DNA-binding protein